VNLVTEGDYESEEEEEWWVSTVRVEEEEEKEEEEEEEEDMEEVENSEPEEDGKRETRYFTGTHVRKDDSGLEDELEYFCEAPSPADPYEREEDRWWSPGPPEPGSEEDEEEVRYLTDVLGLGPKGNEVKDKEPPPLTGGTPSTSGSSRVPPPGRPAERGEKSPGAPMGTEPPHAKRVKRRRLRKKVTEDKDQRWETARRDAWLRELLTDSLGSGTEENYTRFAESGQWVAEMTGIRDKRGMGVQEGSMETGVPQQTTTTS
jgi:hypothetical protein